MKHLRSQNRIAFKAYHEGNKELFYEYVKSFCKVNGFAEDEVFVEREEFVPYIKCREDCECLSIGYCVYCNKWRDGYEIIDYEICHNCKLKEDLTEENRQKLNDIQNATRPRLSLHALKTNKAPTVKKRIKEKLDKLKK